MMQEKDSRIYPTVRGYQITHEPVRGLTSAMEDYLEMIGRLCEDSGYTRVKVLSARMQVRPSSVSKMVGKLKEKGYLSHDTNGGITLSASGREYSAFLLRCHRVIQDFLTMMNSPAPLEETELLEHSFSSETLAELERLTHFFRDFPEIYQKFISY